MQRLLTVETRQQSQRTLALTPLGTLVTLAIYLTHRRRALRLLRAAPGPGLPRPDEIFPFFIRTAMPELLRGLMLTAIVLASIDSPLGSLPASFVTDIYRPLLVRGAERAPLHARLAARGGGLRAASSPRSRAWFSFFDRILWLAFKIAGVTFGSLLGVFLLGLLTRLRANRANVVAMVAMALVNLVLLVLAETRRDRAGLVVAGDPRHGRDHGPRRAPGARARPRPVAARPAGALSCGRW